MWGTLSGSTAPDVSSIVCQFYRVNKDDIQKRGCSVKGKKKLETV